LFLVNRLRRRLYFRAAGKGDKIVELEHGAEDYVTKPINLCELILCANRSLLI